MPRREYSVRRPLKRGAPAHPGALMREVLEDLGFPLTILESARRMKVSRQTLYDVLNGKTSLTTEMALRFARLTGGAPELYLQMQVDHDLETARQRLKADLAAIEPAAIKKR